MPDPQVSGLSACLLGLWLSSQKHSSLCRGQTALRRLATSQCPRHHPQMVGAASCRARLSVADDVSGGGGEQAMCLGLPGVVGHCLGASWGPHALGLRGRDRASVRDNFVKREI